MDVRLHPWIQRKQFREVWEAMAGQQSAHGDARQKSAGSRSGGVQSIERAFALLEVMAGVGGRASVTQLAALSRLPLPTIHRIVRTLVDLGCLRQEPSREYVLGPKLIRLGESAQVSLRVWTRPHLEHAVMEIGESVNLAMLDGDEVVYVAQAQSQKSMRMFTEVGRRVSPHCTAVGKALLAQMPWSEASAILNRSGMPRLTDTTITSVDAFHAVLEKVSEQGYATDEGEFEAGVRCAAVAVPNVGTRLALSVSGPASRMTDELLTRAIPVLSSVARDLSAAMQ